MTSADDSSRSIIIVLGRSERQVVEFGSTEFNEKKKISRVKKETVLPSMNTLILGKESQNENVRMTALTLSSNRNNTCAC